MCISNASFMATGYKVLQTAELLLLSKKSVILSRTGQKNVLKVSKEESRIEKLNMNFCKGETQLFSSWVNCLKAVMSSSNETDKIKISLK